ncbi:hypothetical protein BST97_02255 [Nonlabens spongiae]|uniref:Thioredoxin domain-containing protein n=1 Tax=Nonlabens spongiae TaxID=331648 RepID=A0A1W6MH23_9FLAO|nr:TlpA disulfide reductase family protein [Nonlabens spongiae]ARN76914.1 hypothetical protein BST97_02255 [Nonlabens spongiae]
MRYLLSCLTVLLFISCNSKQEEKYAVSGTAPGVLNGIRAYYNVMDERGQLTAIDTSIIMDEKFVFDIKENLESPELRVLKIDGIDSNLLFITSPEGVEISVDKDSIANSTVKGGPINDAMTEYQTEKTNFQAFVKDLSSKRNQAMQDQDRDAFNQYNADYQKGLNNYKQILEKLQRKNEINLVGTMTLGELINMKVYDEKIAREQYNKLEKNVQNLPMSQQIDAYLKRIESVAVGQKAPLFEGHNPDGEVIKLEEIMGKVTLIDFWASWCKPCRAENPNVVAAYEKYHDKGFNILSVSLDQKTGRESWIKAIEDDKMTWNHISRLQYFGPLAKLYNVNAIPATFLLDENGVIIDKNLRGQALHNRLEDLLGEGQSQGAM